MWRHRGAAARRANDDTQAHQTAGHRSFAACGAVPRPADAIGTDQTMIEVNGSVGSGRYSVTLLIGAPGAGKGTQAENVRTTLGLPHVATGDLLRDHRRQGTALGRTARAYMDRGALVPDDLVVQMVLDRLELPDAANGVLLDGFPRTMVQAESLDQELAARNGRVQAALFLNVPEKVLVRRLSGRRVCEGCHGTFHIDLHVQAANGHCPKCNERLVHRRDDHPAAVSERIAIFLKQTTTVLQHYREQGIVHEVNGDQPVERIWADLLKILNRTTRSRSSAPPNGAAPKSSRTPATAPTRPAPPLPPPPPAI
jgi:adenylate kinase